MSYSPTVRAGGPSATRTLDAVVVRKASVGPMDNNVYLLTCRRSGHQLLVDAASDPERVLDLVREGSAAGRLDAVVTTHRHADHHGALRDVVAASGARTIAGRADVEGIPVATDEPVDDGDSIRLGEVTLDVIALRGHTPGSIALAYTEPAARSGAPEAVPGRVHLFTGDSLFPGGVGNTDRDAGRFAQLLADVRTRLFDRFDDAWVYPGHGADTTLGAERPHLEEWRARGW